MARDHGLWPNADFPDYTENPSIYGSAGEVGFYPVGHGLFITYGKCRFFGPPEGVEPTYIFAKITEKLDELYELGRHIGRHGIYSASLFFIQIKHRLIGRNRLSFGVERKGILHRR